MEFIKIILVSILLSISYGILHDMVTANLCVEYFTIGHPKVIESESPFLLAIVWGALATWWAGLIIGIGLAFSAQLGTLPKLNAKQIIRPIIKLLGLMGSLAIISGIIGFILAKTETIHLMPHLADKIIAERHQLFLTAGWAHGASYISGFIGGIILCILTVRKRGRMKNDFVS
jgi:hypothetical protein